MAVDHIEKGGDGFFYPASEAELVGLVRYAYAEGLQLRVRGSAHSVSHAIYTDPQDGLPNHVEQQSPPKGDNVNVMLDRYRGWEVVDEQRRLVRADAGIHLLADPNDPTGTATLETSLLWQLWQEKGWALSDTGGIAHQTVSGFTATGSSGGSLTYSVNNNLHGFRIIDGTGEMLEVSRDDADPDAFFAMSPNMGLLGVVSSITIACVDTFNITGQEAISTTEDCAVDMFGAGDASRPSLEQFLRDAEYARLEWWPQRGAERVLVWQCQQIRPQLGFLPTRYEEFTTEPAIAEPLISVLYTVLGNLDDLKAAKPKLEPSFAVIERSLELLPEIEKLGETGKVLAKFITVLAEAGVGAAITLLEPFAGLIRRELPTVFPGIIGLFVGLDSSKSGMQAGEPQAFRDYGWQGLPMDNQANDELVPTEFTEIWIPLPHTQQAMQLLRDYFDEPTDAHEAYRRTGLYAWELYSAQPTPFWMAASHTDGEDEWKDGAFRIDVYWFANNPDDPAETFFPAIWQLIRDADIPMRLHWGKFQPVYPAGDQTWVNYFQRHYPRWNDFLDLRRRRDPNNIFLTNYWRDRFGLWELASPRPGEDGHS